MGISTNLGYAVGIAGVVLACAVGPAFAAADAPAAVSAYPAATTRPVTSLSLIHISEPTRPY